MQMWASQSPGQEMNSVFWLYGSVGLGKTTITKTFPERWEALDMLGASFSLPIQPNQLIIEPFRKIPSLENYKSVVIDALDQCIGPEGVNKEQGQSLVLQFIQTLVIAQLLTILLCSRQEKWIEEALEELPHLSGNMERFASDSREWNYVKP
ncbi:hypothetical protein CC1G_15794 [Coprinopsis cinerea okayama7|uniref:NACHT domain-containing protein n=1 Tax=Coprinopsis cinerea (strain Okayama-7 / 130 / ATCC MYA-4618 / FGSC 9003) TaxID=240176 RepID=D6RQZ7_COPC7|nr:hypothetical protein CC1G_15794 [Coprinopsis cinerea okayama7\|eukprot:XP_002910074.1 hypothetical protein CC1G_15794 [Coprinopsis cinerea okayama7\